jgi:hypothetical protein
VCADVSLFSFYQVFGTTFLLMGNESHVHVLSVMVDLKLTSGKTVRLKNVEHVPTIIKNLVIVRDEVEWGAFFSTTTKMKVYLLL